MTTYYNLKQIIYIFYVYNRYYEKIGKETKDITDELPFEIPENWEWIRLKNLSLYLYSGKTPKYNNIPNDNLIIGQAANNGIKIDYNFAKYGTNIFFESMPDFYFLKKYDVLLNTLGNGTIGRSGIFMDDKTNVLTDGHLFVMRNLYKETSFFLRHFLFLMRTEIEKSSTGTTNQIFLSMSTVGNYLIPLPPLSEQQRIVERIEQIEPLLQQYDKLEKQLTKLENEITDKLKKSILQYAIEGKLVKQDPNDEPASVLLERIKAEKEKLIKEGKIKRDKNESFIYQGDDKNYYEKLPNNWVILPLKQIVFNHGQKIPDKTFSYIDIGSIDNINQKLNANENIILPDKAPSRARKIICYGDIIYSTVRPYLHNMCIIDKEFSYEPIASTGFAVLATYNFMFNKYLFYYLLSPLFDNYANNNENSKGVTYPAINDDRLYKALICFPNIEEQTKIVNKIESLFKCIK